MQRTPVPRPAGNLPGIVDTLSSGYQVVNRHLWVLLLPVCLDLLLLLGPWVSVAPLVEPFLEDGSALVRDAASQEGGTSATVASEYEQLRTTLVAQLRETNVLGVIAQGPLAVPSAAILLVGGVGFAVQAERFTHVESWGTGLLLVAALLVTAVIYGGLYRALLARQVRGRSESAAVLLVRFPRDLKHVVQLGLIVFGAALLAAFPATILLGLASALVPPLAAFLFLLLLVGLVYVEIHLLFALDAVFVSGTGPRAAIRRSVAIIRAYWWPAVGLLLLTWLILSGMSIVWELLATTLDRPLALSIAILGNAYIASGLIAARMVFYRDRMRLASVPSAGPPPPASQPTTTESHP